MTITLSLRRTAQPQQHHVLTLGSVQLDKVSSLRLLRVMLTDTLAWNLHVDTLCKKVSSMLGVIKRAGNCANVNLWHRLFDAFVKPRMLYCLPVWGNSCEMSSNKLDRTCFAHNYA